MNYAWAHPTTGIREQTEKSTPERMLAEARFRLWTELQEQPAREGDIIVLSWPIYRQSPVGEITVNGPSVDPVRIAEFNASEPGYQFAWADPQTGARVVGDNFPGVEVVDQLKALQENRDSKDSVVVYATWEECIVSRAEARPEPPAPMVYEDQPERSERAGDAPDIDQQRRELEEVIILDDSLKVAKITAWALLDIASTIREMSGDLRYPPEAETAEEPKHVFKARNGNWFTRAWRNFWWPVQIDLPGLSISAKNSDDAAEALGVVAEYIKKQANAADVARDYSRNCVRCGAPYLFSGMCSRHLEGCRGGRGDASDEERAERAEYEELKGQETQEEKRARIVTERVAVPPVPPSAESLPFITGSTLAMAKRINEATSQQIAAARAKMPPDVQKWGDEFESLAKVEARQKPHVFVFRTFRETPGPNVLNVGPETCAHCGLPENDAVHGYTAD